MAKNDLEQFCFYPFTQLLLQPTGAISPCCWNQQIVLGNAPETTIAEAWNSDALRSLRREFLEGKPVSCRKQMNEIGCNRWSRRPEDTPLAKIHLAEEQPGPPRRLDLRLNGKCNLQCVMCSVWQQPNGVYDGTDLWTKGPSEIFPYLEEIDMLGGEPFVQADTFRLMEEVSSRNSRCSWGFVTNGQYRFNGTIRSRLDQLEIRWIQLSLDSVNEDTYAKIRVNGRLERALETLQSLREFRAERYFKNKGGFRLSLSMCVQKANWHEVGEFLDFAKRIPLEVDLQFAYDPDPVSLLTLSPEERRRALDYFSEVSKTFGLAQLRPLILPLEGSLG